MSRKGLTISACVAGLALCGQASAQPRVAATNPVDLPQRMLGSEVIVIGTVVGSEVAPLRQTEEEKKAEQERKAALYERMARGIPVSLDLPSVKSGRRVTVAVNQVLCARENFAAAAIGLSRPAGSAIQVGDQVALFFPNEEVLPTFDSPNNPELLLDGHRYLLLLHTDPSAAENIENYQIDPEQTYFRAVQKERGAFDLSGVLDQDRQVFQRAGVPLSSSAEAQMRERANRAQAFTSRVTALCEALKPAAMSQKIDRLQLLFTGGDEAMRQNARAVIDALNASTGR